MWKEDGSRTTRFGSPGTIYLSDASFFPSETLIGGLILIPGFTSWSPSSLTVSNALTGFANGFQLIVTNDLTINDAGGLIMTNGSLNIGGNLICSNNVHGKTFFNIGTNSQFTVASNMVVSSGCWFEVQSHVTNALSLQIGGNLILTNNGILHVFSGMTNGVSPDYGALVSVVGDVNIASNSCIYPYSHPTNGGSVLFRMRNLTVAAGGKIDADSKGYAGSMSGDAPGRHDGRGPGLGCGGAAGAIYRSGGGYGGVGGNQHDTYSLTYGSSNAPVDPGSGGGSYDSLASGGADQSGKAGGGLVRIEAPLGKVIINGTITANSSAGGNYGGAGSGGGVYIKCKTIEGAGRISANGGDQTGVGDGGGSAGGGGRIAVWRVNHRFTTNDVSATGGIGHDAAHSGTNGTVVWGWLPPAGSIFTVH